MYDIKVCIAEAHAFLHTAKLLEDELDTMIGGGMYPFAVNATFACELYMKAILMHNSSSGTIVKSHKLDDLFSSLPNGAKTQIEASYSQNCTSDLNTLLTEVSTAFVDWRYAFEKGVRINVTGILAFANALKDYVITLQ